MSDIYSQFGELKKKQNDAKNEERAGTTMQYYDIVSDMIDSGEYRTSHETFLYSVQQFIEEHEYISDKQMQVVDKIYNEIHEEVPF